MGIEKMVNLKSLDCRDNQITSLNEIEKMGNLIEFKLST